MSLNHVSNESRFSLDAFRGEGSGCLPIKEDVVECSTGLQGSDDGLPCSSASEHARGNGLKLCWRGLDWKIGMVS